MRLIYEELPKGDEVLVEEVTIKYCQETDCTESDDYQTLTLSTRDGGGGKFINISTRFNTTVISSCSQRKIR
jgi:hypothetical protein